MLFNEDICLTDIMNAAGSDKGDGVEHNYTAFYNELFRSRRLFVERVFELGIGTNYVDTPSNMGPNGVPGASLRGWRQYFPRAAITGADIDRRILFSAEKIRTFFVDQRDARSIAALWDAVYEEPGFDIMVDDGLHEFGANDTFLINSIDRLRHGGIYVVEDVHVSFLSLWEARLPEYRFMFPGHSFEIVRLPLHSNLTNNNLIVCRKHPTAV